jgi:hypothetical protein
MCDIQLDDFKQKINVEKYKSDICIIRNLFKYKQLGPENVSRVVTETVLRVRKFRKLSKSEKAGLAIHTINFLIEELIPGRDAPMEAILKLMVPDLVEQLLFLNLNTLCPCM